MDVLIILLLFLLFYKAKPSSCLLIDAFSLEQTRYINGFFVIHVFIRHFFQYIEPGSYDLLLYKYDVFSQQLIVVPFLFFSGYAMMYKLTAEKSYLNRIVFKALILWFKFLSVVILYFLLYVSGGNPISLETVLLSFFGLNSFGNSTWYVIVIILLWLFSFISFKVFQNVKFKFIALGLFLAIYAYLINTIKPQIWYNTIISYYLGMLFFKFESSIKNRLEKKGEFVLLAVLGLLIVFVCFYYSENIIIYEIRVISFVVLIVLFCYRIKIGNIVLKWLGKYAFEIYMLQRLPMILFRGVINNNMLYFVVSMVITVLISIAFKNLWSLIISFVSKNFRIRYIRN